MPRAKGPKASKATPQEAIDVLVRMADVLSELAMHHPEEGYVRKQLREIEAVFEKWK